MVFVGQSLTACLLLNQDAAIRSGLDADSCMSEMVLALVAGSETTASTIRWTMLQLLSTPRVYSKLKAVVKEAVDEGRVSTPIKQAEAKEIPYLQVRLSKTSSVSFWCVVWV